MNACFAFVSTSFLSHTPGWFRRSTAARTTVQRFRGRASIARAQQADISCNVRVPHRPYTVNEQRPAQFRARLSDLRRSAVDGRTSPRHLLPCGVLRDARNVSCGRRETPERTAHRRLQSSDEYGEIVRNSARGIFSPARIFEGENRRTPVERGRRS